MKSLNLLSGGLFLLTMVFTGNASAANDQSNQSKPSQNGLFEVTVESRLAPLQLGRIHAWTATITTADGKPVTCAEIKVSGGMPIHNHGFPTEPAVTAEISDGVYLIEGIKFSMRGPWVMLLDIKSGDDTDSVAFDINL